MWGNNVAIKKALQIAKKFASNDGAHHKDWVIDQMVRVLTGSEYANFVAEVRSGQDGPETYEWKEGVAP